MTAETYVHTLTNHLPKPATRVVMSQRVPIELCSGCTVEQNATGDGHLKLRVVCNVDSWNWAKSGNCETVELLHTDNVHVGHVVGLELETHSVVISTNALALGGHIGELFEVRFSGESQEYLEECINVVKDVPLVRQRCVTTVIIRKTNGT